MPEAFYLLSFPSPLPVRPNPSQSPPPPKKCLGLTLLQETSFCTLLHICILRRCADSEHLGTGREPKSRHILFASPPVLTRLPQPDQTIHHTIYLLYTGLLLSPRLLRPPDFPLGPVIHITAPSSATLPTSNITTTRAAQPQWASSTTTLTPIPCFAMSFELPQYRYACTSNTLLRYHAFLWLLHLLSGASEGTL